MEVPGAGALLDGRYEVQGVLGKGSQGVVVRAWDAAQQRDVAIKLRSVDDASRHAVLAEARLLLRITPHPNIALVRADFFAGDVHALVMDFVDGETLGARAGSRSLPVGAVVEWLHDAAIALDHLAAQSPPAAHGDVKPGNLIVPRDGGNAVLVDFGLAGYAGAAGTLGYAAPETSRLGATPAGDRYGLAATAYAVLTGKAPAPGQADDLSPDVRALIARGLSIASDQRPSLATDFTLSLAQRLGITLAPRAENQPDTVPARVQRRRRSAVAAAMAILVGLGSFVAVDRMHADQRSDASSSPTTTATGPTPSTFATPTSAAAAIVVPGRVPTTATGTAGASAAEPDRVDEEVARAAFVTRDGTVSVVEVLASGATRARPPAPGFGEQWSVAARAQPGLSLFYRRSDGANRLATVRPDGTVELGRSNPGIAANWSHFVGLDDGLVYFHRQGDGLGSSHRYGERGTLADQDGYGSSQDRAGFDVAVRAGGNRVLLYRRGRGVLLAVGGAGALSVVGGPRGGDWHTLVPTHGAFAIGISDTGRADLVRIEADALVVLDSVALGAAPWRTGAAVGNGAIVLDAVNGRAAFVAIRDVATFAAPVAFDAPGATLVASVD